MKLRITLLVLMLLVIATHVVAQDTPPSTYVSLDDCFIEIDAALDHDCGQVTVPESYTGDSQRDIRLGIVRFNAVSENPGSPLFMLMGGPGQSIAEFLSSLPVSIAAERAAAPDGPATFSRILENHDIVFMAQRGTEFTEPFLTCPELGSLTFTAYEQQLDADEQLALSTETLQACIDRFTAAGVDFNAYNNEANAADVNSVRAALGYERIIYYGESYGAQLGQFVMRDFPEILEGVVLDGANSLSKTSWAQDRSASFQTALDGMAALCADRPACTEAYGDLNALIDAAIAQFDNGPLTYTYQDAENPDITVEVEIDLDDFAEFIKGQFGFLGNFGLPLMFQWVSEGNLEAIGTQTALGILGSRGASSSFPILMQMAMVCSDDPVDTASDADAEGVSTLALAAGRSEAKLFLLGCPLINVQQLPDTSDVDVSLDVPTLLLGGGLDTRTPIARNQEVADNLPNARLVIFPTGSHVQVPNIPCANAILADFVIDPSALQTLDTACIAELTEAFEFASPE